jgi:hypothetical protein
MPRAGIVPTHKKAADLKQGVNPAREYWQSNSNPGFKENVEDIFKDTLRAKMVQSTRRLLISLDR